MAVAVINTSRSYRLLRHSAFKVRSALEFRWAVLTGQWDWLMRRKYNRWARWGMGHDLERLHTWITEQMLQRIKPSPGDHILDLGCGEGMATRVMAGRLEGSGRIVGLDIAEGMIEHARAKSAAFRNVEFVRAPAEDIPFHENTFHKVLSVEAFYYFRRQEHVLRELFRVLKPGGQLCMVIYLHKDNARSLNLGEDVGMPVHVRSAAEYGAMLWRGGWTEVHTEELVCRPGEQPDSHDRSLAITARKPE